MINKNKVDLYNYTYLNANGYLQKFRNALGYQQLDRALLTKLLKVFNDDLKLFRFIVPNDKGQMCLYNKNMLNNILGIDEVGQQTINPNHNRYLKYLSNLLDKFTYEEYENPEPEDKRSEMEKASDELIYNDNYGEVDESRKMGKRVIFTESQLKSILGEDDKKYAVEPEKVKIVAKFLDDNFIRAGIPCIGEDGYPKTTPIVALKGTDGVPARNMTDKQLFYMLQDKFKNMYLSKDKLNKFLNKVMKNWYYKKISKEGLLDSNLY